MKITCNVRLYRGYVYFTAVTEAPGTDWCFNTHLNILHRNYYNEKHPHFEEVIGTNNPVLYEDNSITKIPDSIVEEINESIVNGNPIEKIEIELFEWNMFLN